MQASPSFFGLGDNLRWSVLTIGVSIVLLAGLLSLRVVYSSTEVFVILILTLYVGILETVAIANSHDIFAPKVLVFRLICYMLLIIGFSVGSNTSVRKAEYLPSSYTFEIVCALIVLVGGAMMLYAMLSSGAGHGSRFEFEGSSPVGLAFSSGSLAVASTAIALVARYPFARLAGGAAFFCFIVACMLSGSRGGLLAALVTSVALVLVRVRIKWNSPKALGGFLLSTLLVVSGFTLLVRSEWGGYQSNYIIDRFESAMDPEFDESIGGDGMRFDTWKKHLTADGLFITGMVGYSSSNYSHNIFIEIIARMGVPLGSFLILIIIVIAMKQLQMLGVCETPLSLTVAFGMALMTLLNAQMNMSLEMLRPLWFGLGVVVGLYAHRPRLEFARRA